jgi:hypothetical protein
MIAETPLYITAGEMLEALRTNRPQRPPAKPKPIPPPQRKPAAMSEHERRARALLSRLIPTPVRIADRVALECCFCRQSIRNGQPYRARGLGARAHLSCFQAVRRQYR